MINAQSTRAESPSEVFPQWREAQLAVGHLAFEPLVAAHVLRTTGFLRPDLAEHVADWFLGEPTGSEDALRQSYRALERETARLYEIEFDPRAASAFGCTTFAMTRTAPPRSSVPSCASTGR